MQRILLIHGLGGEPDHYAASMPALAVAAPEAEVTCPRLPDDFPGAVKLAAEWLAGGPGVVVGHSMGGHVALAAARRVGGGHPLVLLAPGGVGPPPSPALAWAIWSRAALEGRSADDFEAAMRALYADARHPWADRRAAAHRARVGTPDLDRWIDRVGRQVGGVLDAWIGDASDTPGRLFVVRGEIDPLVPEGPLKALVEGHPRARYERWDGVGHMVPDEAPERLARLVVEAGQAASASMRASASI